MATIALWISYDGAPFVGWQVQPDGVSVQQRVEEALTQLCGQKLRIHSSGRTDAGVHACGMVAHFCSDEPLPLSAYVGGLNRFLPAEISVLRAQEVSDQFHARFSAIQKWYRYQIYLSPVRLPLHDRHSWRLCREPNLELMHQATRLFCGEHDFAAFRAAGCSAKTTYRRIDRFDLSRKEARIRFDVRGTGFLRNMVRMLIGSIVEVGLGRRSLSDLQQMLQVPDLNYHRLTAPARGLCLMEVCYPEGLLQPEKPDRLLEKKNSS